MALQQGLPSLSCFSTTSDIGSSACVPSLMAVGKVELPYSGKLSREKTIANW